MCCVVLHTCTHTHTHTHTDKTGWPVLRGGWFEVSNDKWYPLPEDEYTAVEEEHVARKWREKVK